MEIKIHVLELEEAVKYLYLDNQLSNFGIDYQTSTLTAERKMNMLEGVKYHSTTVYDFSKILKLDSRYSSYEIVKNTAEIIIKFKVGD